MKKPSDVSYPVEGLLGTWPKVEVTDVTGSSKNIFEQAYGPMTDEARAEAKKLKEGWGMFTKTPRIPLDKLQLSELQEIKEDTSQKYPGQELSSRRGFGLTKYELQPFAAKLKNFPLVDEVYVLEDNRDPENPTAATSVVRLLVRLINMSKTPPAVLEHQNMLLTEFLMNTSVENAVQVEVTFQYTEVYFGAF